MSPLAKGGLRDVPCQGEEICFPNLGHRHAFSQVAGTVDGAIALAGAVVGQQLQHYRLQHRSQQQIRFRRGQHQVSKFADFGVVLIGDGEISESPAVLATTCWPRCLR